MMLSEAARPSSKASRQHLRARARSGNRIIDANRKTEICKHWVQGACPYGAKCAFAHGPQELRSVSESQSRARTSHSAASHAAMAKMKVNMGRAQIGQDQAAFGDARSAPLSFCCDPRCTIHQGQVPPSCTGGGGGGSTRPPLQALDVNSNIDMNSSRARARTSASASASDKGRQFSLWSEESPDTMFQISGLDLGWNDPAAARNISDSFRNSTGSSTGSGTSSGSKASAPGAQHEGETWANIARRNAHHRPSTSSFSANSIIDISTPASRAGGQGDRDLAPSSRVISSRSSGNDRNGRNRSRKSSNSGNSSSLSPSPSTGNNQCCCCSSSCLPSSSSQAPPAAPARAPASAYAALPDPDELPEASSTPTPTGSSFFRPRGCRVGPSPATSAAAGAASPDWGSFLEGLLSDQDSTVTKAAATAPGSFTRTTPTALLHNHGHGRSNGSNRSNGSSNSSNSSSSSSSSSNSKCEDKGGDTGTLAGFLSSLSLEDRFKDDGTSGSGGSGGSGGSSAGGAMRGFSSMSSPWDTAPTPSPPQPSYGSTSIERSGNSFGTQAAWGRDSSSRDMGAQVLLPGLFRAEDTPPGLGWSFSAPASHTCRPPTPAEGRPRRPFPGSAHEDGLFQVITATPPAVQPPAFDWGLNAPSYSSPSVGLDPVHAPKTAAAAGCWRSPSSSSSVW